MLLVEMIHRLWISCRYYFGICAIINRSGSWLSKADWICHQLKEACYGSGLQIVLALIRVRRRLLMPASFKGSRRRQIHQTGSVAFHPFLRLWGVLHDRQAQGPLGRIVRQAGLADHNHHVALARRT